MWLPRRGCVQSRMRRCSGCCSATLSCQARCRKCLRDGAPGCRKEPWSGHQDRRPHIAAGVVARTIDASWACRGAWGGRSRRWHWKRRCGGGERAGCIGLGIAACPCHCGASCRVFLATMRWLWEWKETHHRCHRNHRQWLRAGASDADV